MKVSLNWLKEYVAVPDDIDDIVHSMTMAGTAVEGVEERGITAGGQKLHNILTGKIINIEPHGNAEKLQVCKVEMGNNEIIVIVTGAKNVAVGDIVPVACNNSIVASGQKIVTSKLRGVESQGMFCSAEELGLDAKVVAVSNREGIYILPQDTKLGVNIIEVLALDDVVLEFELTANRADCFSMRGIAREMSVIMNQELKAVVVKAKEDSSLKTTGGSMAVVVEDEKKCPRFAGRRLENIKIEESPLWLQCRLQAAGVRPINNVVDVTNYVMLEMGQPLHAYDYDLIAGKKITVRQAQAGEKLTTLDGIERELTEEMLVIADAKKAIGLAGVMGGQDTEVRETTKTIFLEAAKFDSMSIRKTARKLGLRSEASGRFERGVDIVRIPDALDRVAALLQAMSACEVAPGIVDVRTDDCMEAKVIKADAEAVSAYLGLHIDNKVMRNILVRLGFVLQEDSKIVVPSWRGDVEEFVDIVEEVARIYGYDKVPEHLPEDTLLNGGQSIRQDMYDEIRKLMRGMGFSEIISYSFTNEYEFDKLRLKKDSHLRQAIPLVNPIVQEMSHLRTNLWGKMLSTIHFNLQRKNEELRLYEIGVVFQPHELPLTELPREDNVLCACMSGKRHYGGWDVAQDSIDFYDMKGALEELLTALGMTKMKFRAAIHPVLHDGKTAIVSANGKTMAVVGQIHPEVRDNFAIKKAVYLFQLNLDILLPEFKKGNKKYTSISSYPEMVRDMGLVLPVEIMCDEVTACIEENGGEYLRDIHLFDIYVGEQLAKDKKSMAFSLSFQSNEKTLTDEEVSASFNRIVAALQEKCGAELRTY